MIGILEAKLFRKRGECTKELRPDIGDAAENSQAPRLQALDDPSLETMEFTLMFPRSETSCAKLDFRTIKGKLKSAPLSGFFKSSPSQP